MGKYDYYYFLIKNTKEDFLKKIYQDSYKFRQSKIKELREITDLEKNIIEMWANIYGVDAW